MFQSLSEAAVPLENLDTRMKAILKLKLRELVHLHPCFRDIPSIDPEAYKNRRVADFKGYMMVEPNLVHPNKIVPVRARRRHARLLAAVAR